MTRPARTPPPGSTRTTTRRSDAPADCLWRAAWVLPVAREPIRDGAVVVRGGEIVAVGPAGALRSSHPGLTERDLGERIVAPGFVNAHCHLEWSLLDGLLPPDEFAEWLGRLLPMRRLMSPADHEAAAVHGALRALASGTTTVIDSGPTGAGAGALAASGLRGLVHLEAFGREEGEEARAAAGALGGRLAELDAAVGPRGRVGISPHAPYTVGPGFWRALRERFDGEGRPWATHLAESAAEERVIAHGDGPLGDLFARADLEPGRWPGGDGDGPVPRLARAGALEPGLVAAHCVRLGPGDAATLAREGVGVAHCPRSNAYLRCGRAPLEELREAGVAVGLGTDSPASGGDYDLRAEARACWRAHAPVMDLDDDALLRLITLDAARAAGLDASVGSLAPGRRADLVVLAPARSGGPPAAAALDPGTLVELVVVDGEIVFLDGAPTRVDAGASDARAEEVRGRLC